MTHLKRYQYCIINLKLLLLNKRNYMSTHYPRSIHCYILPKTVKAEQSFPNWMNRESHSWFDMEKIFCCNSKTSDWIIWARHTSQAAERFLSATKNTSFLIRYHFSSSSMSQWFRGWWESEQPVGPDAWN